MKRLKYIIFVILIMLFSSFVAFAAKAPEITSGSAIKAEEPVSIRVKAVIDLETAQSDEAKEYGFIVTRKVFLTALGKTNDMFTLDCGAYFVKGVSKGVENGIEINHFFEKTDSELYFTGLMHGITPYFYSDIIVARPYLVYGDNAVYGAPEEMSIYSLAKSIRQDAEVYNSMADEQKKVIDSIILYVEGEPYEINRRDLRIVLSSCVVKNLNPTYSVCYTLYNPFTGEILTDVMGRKKSKSIDEISAMLLEAGKTVPVYNGVVQDTTEGYVTEGFLNETPMWVVGCDIENSEIVLVDVHETLACDECITEYIDGAEKLTLTFSNDTVVSCFAGDFANASFSLFTANDVENKNTQLLCFNNNGETVEYSDYIKTYASFNGNECEYLLAVVNDNENSAKHEICIEHKYFDVQFYADGNAYDTQSVKYSNTPTLPVPPQKVGYTFLGWSDKDGGDVVNPESVAVTENTAYYAVFEIKTFEVAFYTDGSIHDTQSVKYGTTPALPVPPQKVGYTFLGWTDKEGGDVVNPESTTVTENTTYYAVFEIKTFEVTFYTNGSIHDTQSVKYGNHPTLPESPEKVGYTFLGWSDKENGDVVNPESTTVTENTAYYAVFEIKTFEVTFYTNGSIYDTQSVKYGTTPALPVPPQKVGYTFLGWSDKENGDVVNPESVAVTENITYYAVFEIKTFEVTFYTDGSIYDTQSVKYSNTPTLPVPPQKVGYTFLGWTDKDGGDVVNPESATVTENTAYYAVFKKIENCNVTFYVEGTVVSTQKVEFGSFAVIPESPEVENAKFLGWSPDESASADSVIDVSTTAIVSDTIFYAVILRNPNSPEFMEKLSRGYTQISSIKRVTGKAKTAINLIKNTMALVLEEANNYNFIDTDYIKEFHGTAVDEVKDIVKVQMSKNERSQFANLIKSVVSEDVQTFLSAYFGISMDDINK